MNFDEICAAADHLEEVELMELRDRIEKLLRRSVEPSGFSWYGNYTEALAGIRSKAKRAQLIDGIIEYGSYGTFPDFADPYLQSLFAAIRPNIDKSRMRRQAGAKGGKAKPGPKAGTTLCDENANLWEWDGRLLRPLDDSGEEPE